MSVLPEAPVGSSSIATRILKYARLHTTITRIQQINKTLDCDLETATEQLINDLLHGTGRDQRKAL